MAKDPKKRWRNIRAEPQSRFPPGADRQLAEKVRRVQMGSRFFVKKVRDDLCLKRRG
jgi:hypothetical protein